MGLQCVTSFSFCISISTIDNTLFVRMYQREVLFLGILFHVYKQSFLVFILLADFKLKKLSEIVTI